MNRTALLCDPQMLEHDTGPDHPESRSRLDVILQDLQRKPVPGTSWLSPRVATDEELLRVHAASYLAELKRLDGQRGHLDPDTVVSPRSWTAARLAAGAAHIATEAVWSGRVDNAFALVRPPGHHAEHARGMGFCLLNSAAVAAESALTLGARRVAILDWDVHHGNGTQKLFEARDDVLYLSAHQYPFYPGTGAPDEIGVAAGAGFTVNCALPPRQSDADYGAVFRDVFLPALHTFAPDILIVSAGFDAHVRDPLGQMQLTERGFAAMCSALMDVAVPSAAAGVSATRGVGKMVMLLEGGYDLAALATSVRACVEVMTGTSGHETFPAGTSSACAAAMAATRSAHPSLSQENRARQ